MSKGLSCILDLGEPEKEDAISHWYIIDRQAEIHSRSLQPPTQCSQDKTLFDPVKEPRQFEGFR